MKYVLDTNSLLLLRKLNPKIFKLLWQKLDFHVSQGDIISVDEVFKEVDAGDKSFLFEWCKENKSIFTKPSNQEAIFISEIFAIPHFQALIKKEVRLRGGNEADPFVIAKAKIIGGTVVSEEGFKPNSAKIPNVCKHFNIQCIDLNQMMLNLNWSF